jgi:hypothetical protein
MLFPDPAESFCFNRIRIHNTGLIKYCTQMTIERNKIKNQRVKERDEWKAPGEHEVV